MNSKKNLLQSLLFLAIIAVCSFTFSACSDDDDIDEAELIGTWKYTNVTGSIKITGNGMTQLIDLATASEGTENIFSFAFTSMSFSSEGTVIATTVEDEKGETSDISGRWSIKDKSLLIDNSKFATISKLKDGQMTLLMTQSGMYNDTNMTYSIQAYLHFTKTYLSME